MLKITETTIKRHAENIGIQNLALAELDYRLMHTLFGIYSNSFLSERLLLKGGTAINRFYLGKVGRLSVDLDFNAVGEKEDVLINRNEVRDNILSVLEEQDSNYKVKKKDVYGQTTIKAQYTPLFGKSQYLKVEISTVERFPVLKKVKKKVINLETGEKINVETYCLEELCATKIRALYDRLRGRDIYDLVFISRIDLNYAAIKKLVLYYFYRTGKIFNSKLFFKNVREKFLSNRYVDDVSSFIKGNVEFDIRRSIPEILHNYSFLKYIDERDECFILLSKWLQDKIKSKKKIRKVARIKYPLRYLFEDIAEISTEAYNTDIDKIRIKWS